MVREGQDLKASRAASDGHRDGLVFRAFQGNIIITYFIGYILVIYLIAGPYFTLYFYVFII